MKPDGVFLSNGPGDPEAVVYAQKAIRKMVGRVPIFGICLGHQLIGLALGGRTYKLKFGHHGGNHPVKQLATGKMEITAHNHNYAVDPDSLKPERGGVDARGLERQHAGRPAPSHLCRCSACSIIPRLRPGRTIRTTCLQTL